MYLCIIKKENQLVMGKATITKEQISTLEKVTFPGKIYIVDSMAKVKSALAYLNKCERLGLIPKRDHRLSEGYSTKCR